MLGTSFTDEILMGGEMVGMKEVKKIVKEVDRKLLLSRCRGKAPMIAKDGGWLRLWDEALNLGERHTKGLKNLSRVLSHHGRGSKPCQGLIDSFGEEGMQLPFTQLPRKPS